MQFSINRLLLCMLLAGSVTVGEQQLLKASDFTIILIGYLEPEPGIDFTASCKHVKVQDIANRQVSIAPIDHNNTFYAGLNPDKQYRIALVGENGKEVSVKFISTYNRQNNEVIYVLFRCNT